jgi:amino acid transporter
MLTKRVVDVRRGSEQETLSDFGYQQELQRGTGKFASFAVAFAFVSIATGVFTTYGSVLSSSGPAGIWTWPLVVFGQLMVALVFGSLAARIPITGYSYQWMSRLSSPALGWFMGWISFTFLAIGVVAVDYTIVSAVLPVLLNFSGSTAYAWCITAAVIIAQSLLVAFSTRWTERVNNIAVIAELTGMFLIVILLLAVGYASHKLNLNNLFATAPIPTQNYMSFGTLTHVGPWIMGTLLGAFTLVGFESAANLAEETEKPADVVPRAMWQAVLASGVLGFLFLIAVTAMVGNPAELAKSTAPIAEVITKVLGTVVGDALLLLVLLSIFACGLITLVTASRLVWAMSRDARFPGHTVLRKISPNFKTPLAATFFMAAICEVVLGIFAFRPNALVDLFSAGTLLPCINYAVTILVYAFKRRSLPVSQGFTLGRWEVPVLTLAIAWLAFEFSIFRDESFQMAWAVTSVIVLIGLIYLGMLLVRSGGSKGLTMPGMHSIDLQESGINCLVRDSIEDKPSHL